MICSFGENMNKSEVVDQIKELIASELDANLTVAEIGEGDSLFEDGLGLDSVAIVEFITILEDRFKVQFSDMDLTKEMFRNISTIADSVMEKAS
jgi:acyl carrier protein